MTATIERAGTTVLLRLDDRENRLTPDVLDVWEQALQRTEQDRAVSAFVSVGTGKFYSNGLDLDHMAAHPETADAYLDRVCEVLHRLLVLPVATVAAVNGHAFGAGAMLTLAHDARVMRQDRGYWCLPEVDLGIGFLPLMSALIRSKLSPSAAQEAMTSGRRYAAPDAAARAMVDLAVPETDVLAAALGIAAERSGKDRSALGGIKADIHAAVATARPG